MLSGLEAGLMQIVVPFYSDVREREGVSEPDGDRGVLFLDHGWLLTEISGKYPGALLQLECGEISA